MASSTTKPTESTIASTVSKFRENPITAIAAVAPSSEIGMVISGTKAVRTDPISSNTTSPTSNTVSARVLKISLMALRI